MFTEHLFLYEELSYDFAKFAYPLIKQNLTKGLGIAGCCLFDLKERNI